MSRSISHFNCTEADAPETNDSFLTQVSSVLRDSDVPLRIILDFRYNGGGIDFRNALKNFSASVNRCATNGVYILINGGCVSAGVYTPYCLRQTITDSVLVGSPTAQFVNCPAEQYAYTLPNSNYTFYISSKFYCNEPNKSADALYPDILIYQTWEDYLQSVDSCLNYALTCGNESPS